MEFPPAKSLLALKFNVCKVMLSITYGQGLKLIENGFGWPLIQTQAFFSLADK